MRLGATIAMLTGREPLPTELLGTIRVDDAAEIARTSTRAATKRGARRRPNGSNPNGQEQPGD